MSDVGRYELVIFDMDGTLVDSERHFWPMIALVLKTNAGVEVTHQEMEDLYGGWEIMRAIADMGDRFGIDPTSYWSDLENAYFVSKPDMEATRGAKETLQRLADKKRAVASNGSPEYVDDTLRAAGLTHYFDAIFTHADVPLPKPAPDIYLHAAEKFSVDPAQCIVLEDRLPGIEAALAANMKVVGFCGNSPKNRENLCATGITVIDDFAEFEALVRQ